MASQLAVCLSWAQKMAATRIGQKDYWWVWQKRSDFQTAGSSVGSTAG